MFSVRHVSVEIFNTTSRFLNPCVSSLQCHSYASTSYEISLAERSEQLGSGEANDVFNKIIYSLVNEHAIHVCVCTIENIGVIGTVN